MALNFNVDPYYDDFDQTKNFHRILFKPGFAVQARELTQSQTILQDQITKFADNIFKQNSPVTGGQVTTNFGVYYIKLQDTYLNSPIDVTQFNGLLVQNATGSVIARVLGVSAATGGDPNTLIVSYLSGTHFNDNDVIYDVNSNLAAQAVATNSTGSSSVASIAQGVFYVLGNFVQISPSTIVLSKYSNKPNLRVGLTITETVQDYIGDSSLLDPAIGASNYQAPGADRYQIILTLDTRPLTLGDDADFIELVRITNGSVAKMVDGSVYNVIDDYFAKRDYETNGDYVVNDFKLTPKTNADSTKYTMSIGKGIAYVHGYRLENQAPLDLVSNRARTTAAHNNNPVYIDFGSYFYLDNVRGANTGYFDVTSTQTIDLHCVDTANVDTTSSATYNATLVGSGYIRALTYDHDTSDTDANTFVYKAYVNDIQNFVPTANAVAGGTSTITLPSTYSSMNSAYVGVTISITAGVSAGDLRTITAYNGSTKVATVNQPWTVTPTTNSTFTLNLAIKDIESVLSVDTGSYPATVKASALINAESKTGGLSTGNTILENPTIPEMIFTIGSPYVASLTDTTYTTQQVFRNIAFQSSGGHVVAELNYSGIYADVIRHFGTPNSTLSDDIVRQNYTIIVTNPLSSGLNTGDIIPWIGPNRTVQLDVTGSIATFLADDLTPFDAIIIAKVDAVDANNPIVLKTKNLITANTTGINISGTTVNTYTHVDDTALTSYGQVYIQHAGLVTPGSSQSLYLSDVKQIVKIIDTKNSTNTPTVAMLSNPVYDVTNNYVFDSGQKDSFYDHATITLKPGASQPIGNLLVLVDYYQHAGGDGYFSVYSYLNSSSPEQYQTIPQYSSRHGTVYPLRDCIDFRPARKNAQADFIYRYANKDDTKHGAYLPLDLSIFTGSYSYYLGRKDKLVLSKDRSFQIVEGSPSLTPLFPAEPDGSLVVAELTHNPYTGYIPTEAPTGSVSDLNITKVKHKRYTMQDIAGIENRINNIEYYTSLSQLEQNAQSLQIPDAFGLNRFKNGIMVDDFSSYSTADTTNPDYFATINRRTKQMTATQTVENFPLKSLALAYNMGQISTSAQQGLGYSINADGYVNYFSLPYTSANVVTQQLASRTVNVNPFSFSVAQGITTLTPNVDNWVDNKVSPALLITDPNLQVFQANSAAINVLSAGDWKTISGTSYTTQQSVVNHGRFNGPFGSSVGYTATTTYNNLQQQQTNLVGNYDNIGNTYALNNGYITDISVLPYIRQQQILVRAHGMLVNTPVHTYFDGVDVDSVVRKGNIIELANTNNKFAQDDVVGYYTSGVFHPTGLVIGVYNYPGTSNTRLYVASDGQTSVYTTNGIIQNALYDASGTYQSNTDAGKVVSTSHFGGRIQNIDLANNKVSLSNTASHIDSYYVGNTIYFCSGTGVGQEATINSYYGANQTAVLSTTVSTANGDIYSVGSFSTDETGSFYGIFNLPANSFHTGQRVFRVDNSINGNANSATTYAEGTFYSEGLQTTSQGIDFGASPSGAKGVFTQTNYANNNSISVTYSPYDPVAQTFIVSKDNYPNGLFLNSVKLYFASKPSSANTPSPVTLSIVGTQNGYPNGETLDHSIVTKTPAQIKVSSTPQFLDTTAYTQFNFSAPVYIQPGVLYAFIVKTSSSEYTLWTAANGDTALSSSVKNKPTDPLPSTITKIGSAPYVGALFISQNSQTWTADQNQSLMFVMDRCIFDTAANPTIQYVVPNKLPKRTLIDQSIDYFLNANNVSTSLNQVANTDIYVDAFNITTTDFTPTTTNINYTYNATLLNGVAAGSQNIIPGKFGTATNDDIYLNDGKGERLLIANSNTSFSLYSTLSTTDDAVSPIISDAGLSLYTVKWGVNNCELSNSIVTITNGGSNYNVSNTLVTVSAPTGAGGQQAYASANVVNGVIDKIYFTNTGSGYIETPTLTISVSGGSASGAAATITGETSKSGGNALAKYVTKKVVLDAGFDSGDLNVYLTAYRPANTDINVYYKILNRNDTQKFDDSVWQLMTKTNNSNSVFSQTRDGVYEYTFAPGTTGVDQGYVSYTNTNGQTYNSFSQFAIKVVLTSTDHTYCPVVNDLRVIALPNNVNTTV
jgi:hypothetical protein